MISDMAKLWEISIGQGNDEDRQHPGISSIRLARYHSEEARSVQGEWPDHCSCAVLAQQGDG